MFLNGKTLCTLAAFTILTACGAVTAQAIAQQTVTDLALIDNGLTALGPLLTTSGVPTATLSSIQNDLTLADGFAKAAETATTTAAAQSPVSQAETYLNAALGALNGLPLPPKVAGIVTALNVLMPVIETAVGIVTNAVGASAETPDEARAVLAGV
jgi:hypothetical protein